MDNERAYHRPISITIETIEPMALIRSLPQETQMTVNLKGDKVLGDALISEIKRQIEIAGHFAITITGRS